MRLVQETRWRYDRKVDRVLVRAIRWPARSRSGQPIQTNALLRDILALIENQQKYVAGHSVWRSFINVGLKSFVNERDHDRHQLVRSSFQNLLRSYPSYIPDQHLLQQALDVSAELRDPSVAASTVIRFLEGERRRPKWSQLTVKNNLPSKDVVKGMQICIAHGDLGAGLVILEKCKTLEERIPGPILRTLFSILLKAYAAKGNPRSAQALLKEMKHKSMEVRYVLETSIARLRSHCTLTHSSSRPDL